MANKKFKFTDLSDDIILDSFEEKEIKKNIVSNGEKLLKENKEIKDENNYLEKQIALEKEIAFEQQAINTNNNKEKNNIYSNSINSILQNNDNQFDKIERLINRKEKLEVKTNIYLKKDISEKIKILCLKTGNSRSSIINKLIEMAIKDLE